MEGLPSGYRPNFGVCLINDEGMVFVASRLNVPGAWQMPQGGIEEGEDPRCAAIRELQEEAVSAEIIDEKIRDKNQTYFGAHEADSEFSEWKWTSPQEVMEQAVDYKRLVYEQVMKTFRPFQFRKGYKVLFNKVVKR